MIKKCETPKKCNIVKNDNAYNVSDDYEKNLQPVLNYYSKRVFQKD